MNEAKYIGLDVHQATISVAVLDFSGKLLMEAILETKAATVLQFIHGLRGSLHVTLEEGTCAAWLHDLLKPHVTEVLVCDPRKSALLKSGNKNDRIDARKLADLLRTGLLSPVYHGEHGIRPLKELARSYMAITRDLTRVMVRLKAIYRSWAIPCAGEQVYAPRHRTEWLAKIMESVGVPAPQFLLAGAIVFLLVGMLAGESGPGGIKFDDVRTTYLVGAVAECADCHTERSLVDGSFTGSRLAGGIAMESEAAPDIELVPPNLTPEPRTGRIAAWSEDQFVARFRRGRVIPGSPMPWNAFARMSDDDLRAIYRYLRTVAPVVHETGPAVRPKH